MMDYIEAIVSKDMGIIAIKEIWDESKPIEQYSTSELAQLFTCFQCIMSGKRGLKESYSKEKKIVSELRTLLIDRIKELSVDEKLEICKIAGIY